MSKPNTEQIKKAVLYSIEYTCTDCYLDTCPIREIAEKLDPNFTINDGCDFDADLVTDKLVEIIKNE